MMRLHALLLGIAIVSGPAPWLPKQTSASSWQPQTVGLATTYR